MKSVVMGALSIFMVVGGWFGWAAYQGAQETKFAAQAVQSSAVQTERQIKARKEDGITFAEYFKRGSTAVESLDQIISGLDARVWEYKPTNRDVVIAFVEQCKAVIRSDLAETRLMLDGDNARKSTDAAKKEFDKAESSVAMDYANKRYQRASDELLEILAKQIANVEESTGKIKKLIATDDSVKSTFGAGQGLSRDMVDALKKSIATEG